MSDGENNRGWEGPVQTEGPPTRRSGYTRHSMLFRSGVPSSSTRGTQRPEGDGTPPHLDPPFALGLRGDRHRLDRDLGVSDTEESSFSELGVGRRSWVRPDSKSSPRSGAPCNPHSSVLSPVRRFLLEGGDSTGACYRFLPSRKGAEGTFWSASGRPVHPGRAESRVTHLLLSKPFAAGVGLLDR